MIDAFGNSLGVTMDKDVVKNAIGGIDAILSKAKRALRELIYEKFGGGDDLGGYESPSDAMVYHFDQLYDHLLVILEASEMPEARADLIAKWSEFKKLKGGLRHTDQFGDFDHLTSPVIEYLDHVVSALRMTVSHEITSEEAWQLTRLEEMLRDTDNLVHRRKKAPANEMDLQAIMHDYLKACFPSFVSNPQIGGSIKNFKPDCGIRDIGVAIEFKIAHEHEDAVRAWSGVIEDTAGYKGSKDWTQFYAVVYQAKPFLPRSQATSDLKRIKAATWRAILVNGAVKRKRKVKTAAKKSVRRRPANS